MIIFTAIILATFVLGYFFVRCCRARRWNDVALAIIAMVLLHGVAGWVFGSHMHLYLYRTSDPKVTYLECPFKGVSYQAMLSRFQAEAKGATLYRTFKEDWWNFYRWLDYATHPRWKLPYLPDERHGGSSVGRWNNGETSTGVI